MYRAHAAHLLLIAFVICLVAAVIVGVLALIGGFFGYFLSEIVRFIAIFLVEAALVKAVQDIRDGRADLSLGETVSAATPSIGPIVGASILAGIGIVIGLALLFAPGLFLITIWALIVPVIVIERAGVFDSFSRSQQLVQGYFWPVFGTLVLVFITWIVVSIVLGLILLALPVLLAGFLVTVVAGTLIAPFIALVVTLMFYRLLAVHGGAVATEGPGAGPGAA
jgi:hypothetical protein